MSQLDRRVTPVREEDGTYWRCACCGPPPPRLRCPPARRLRGWPASGRRGREEACADSRTGAAWKTKTRGGFTRRERSQKTQDGPRLAAGSHRELKMGFSQDSLDFLQVVVGVLIGHVRRADVQLEVGSKVLKVVVVWKF